ncbi:exosortase F system-associated membrane protein [Aequorivita nionensis]|uniref:exosortase F system-associated membrane protein n=1 Tax=Aequorivita nionensis TaxID=1287690 RepID=UPI003965965A
MKRPLKIFGIIVFASLLVLIRFFEDTLFYDPLLEFFKMDYKTLPLPKMDIYPLLTSVVFRFLMNTILSLAILWFVFRDKEIIKFSVILYSFLFILLFTAFIFIVFTSEGTSSHMVLFYVRRFLIQPLFLLLLLPAFYFQKYKSR